MELDGGVLILRGGLVVDPRSGTERVADVVVDGGQVVAVETASPGERERHPQADVIDVTGLVVGPGFVDVHSHVHSIAGQRLQALDGVTTTLDLEAGLDAHRDGLCACRGRGTAAALRVLRLVG